MHALKLPAAALIQRLRSDSELLPALAQAHCTEWGYLRPKASLERTQARLMRMCDSSDMPAVFIIKQRQSLVASVTLDRCDYLDAQSGRTPFVTGVYVAPEFRGQGLARVLMEHIEGEAHARGFAALHLDCMPQHESLYSHLGYTAICVRTDRCKFKMTLMVKNISHGSNNG